jgi:ParB family chromosome partitioning protein
MENKLKFLKIEKLVFLRRNPQYLKPRTMNNLKDSIKKDGFLSPVLVRPIEGDLFEIVSGNHRAMAAKEIGYKEIPCIISEMDNMKSRRVAINLNTIHGDPSAELIAPFLAELDDLTLSEIKLDEQLLADVMVVDQTIKERLEKLEAPDFVDNDSARTNLVMNNCKCPTCGKKHAAM